MPQRSPGAPGQTVARTHAAPEGEKRGETELTRETGAACSPVCPAFLIHPHPSVIASCARPAAAVPARADPRARARSPDTPSPTIRPGSGCETAAGSRAGGTSRSAPLIDACPTGGTPQRAGHGGHHQPGQGEVDHVASGGTTGGLAGRGLRGGRTGGRGRGVSCTQTPVSRPSAAVAVTVSGAA